MLIKDVMTRNPQTVTPRDTIEEAARLMDELNVGVLPVCEGDRLVGMLTDRDIVVRSTARGESPAVAIVESVMTTSIHSCLAESAIEEAMELMQGLQIRRMPVVDRQQHLVGIVSLGDLATEAPHLAGEALEDISTPSRPDR